MINTGYKSSGPDYSNPIKNKENIPPKVKSSTIKSGIAPKSSQLAVKSAIKSVESKRTPQKSKVLEKEKEPTRAKQVEKEAVETKEPPKAPPRKESRGLKNPPSEAVKQKESPLAPPRKESRASKSSKSEAVESKELPKAPSRKESQTFKSSQSEAVNKLLGVDFIPALPEENIDLQLPDGQKAILTPEMCKKMYLDHQSVKVGLIQKSEITQVQSQLLKLNEDVPLVQDAVNALRASFNCLDELYYDGDKDGIELKTEEIAVQLNNLCGLVEIVDSFKPEIKEQLSKIQNRNLTYAKDPMGKKWKAVSDQIVSDLILSGQLPLTDEDKKQIKERIENKIEGFKESTEVEARPKESRIKSSAVEAQADLHRAIRKAKGWTRERMALPPAKGDSANLVYQLGDAAFFKIGRDNEKAAGAMETLMWKLAVLFNLEKQFVPTGETAVNTNGSQIKAVLEWNSQGELTNFIFATPSERGGIQPAQKGWTLKDYKELPGAKPKIEKEEILNATLASIVFGMFDAHSGNIFITHEGKIKYFDNTRSMPNANGVIHHEGRYVSPYRSGLLELSDMYSSLTDAQRTQLKTKVAELKEKMVELKEYLYSKDAQILIKKLPPGWLDIAGCIAATAERVDRMEKALDNKNVKNLCDLAVESIPRYKLSFALCATRVLGSKYSNQPALRKELIENPRKLSELQASLKIHTHMGYYSDEDTLNMLANSYVDVAYLKSLAENPNLRTHDIMKAILEHFDALSVGPLSVEYANKVKSDAQNMISALRESAVTDNKDLHRAKSVAILQQNEVQKKMKEISKKISSETLSRLDKLITILREDHSKDPAQTPLILNKKADAISQFQVYLRALPPEEKIAVNQLNKQIEVSKAIPQNPAKRAEIADYLLGVAMQHIKDFGKIPRNTENSASAQGQV